MSESHCRARSLLISPLGSPPPRPLCSLTRHAGGPEETQLTAPAKNCSLDEPQPSRGEATAAAAAAARFTLFLSPPPRIQGEASVLHQTLLQPHSGQLKALLSPLYSTSLLPSLLPSSKAPRLGDTGCFQTTGRLFSVVYLQGRPGRGGSGCLAQGR